ncbi:TadE family protein [Angustibacter sp. McL0619]|uniref:TadE family protein n=1 Tax=Angustibacter sp. McL0619 TaxID=3415676 RepID=UPI003CEBC698
MVDFALVGALLTLLFASLAQLTLVLHVRNTAVDCAAEGARFGARADRVPADGAPRARELVAADLSPEYGSRISQVSSTQVEIGGVQAVQVTMTIPLPLFGLVGSARSMTVRGHAFMESQ